MAHEPLVKEATSVRQTSHRFPFTTHWPERTIVVFGWKGAWSDECLVVSNRNIESRPGQGEEGREEELWDEKCTEPGTVREVKLLTLLGPVTHWRFHCLSNDWTLCAVFFFFWSFICIISFHPANNLMGKF